MSAMFLIAVTLQLTGPFKIKPVTFAILVNLLQLFLALQCHYWPALGP